MKEFGLWLDQHEVLSFLIAWGASLIVMLIASILNRLRRIENILRGKVDE